MYSLYIGMDVISFEYDSGNNFMFLNKTKYIDNYGNEIKILDCKRITSPYDKIKIYSVNGKIVGYGDDFSTDNIGRQESERTIEDLSRSSSEMKYAYNISGLETADGKININYQFVDIVDLFGNLKANFPHKSNYETDGDYNARINEAKFNDFALKVDAKYSLRTQFFPENGIYKVSINTRAPSSVRRDHQFKRTKSILVSEKDKGNREYIGSNAFGATRVVNSYSDDNFYLVINNHYKIKTNDSDDIVAKFIVTNEAAKSLDTNLGVILLCGRQNKIKGDAFIEDTFYTEPTLNQPTEVIVHQKGIVFDLFQILIYDKVDGHVYKKIIYN